MYKFVLCGLMVCFLSFSCASTTPTQTVSEPVTFVEVVDVNGMMRDGIYVRANMWFVDAFRQANSVIQFSDRESGVIMGKYIFEIGGMPKNHYRISSTITVEARDERYRISFTDPSSSLLWSTMAGRNADSRERPIVDKELADEIMIRWQRLANSAKQSITSSNTNTNSDW